MLCEAISATSMIWFAVKSWERRKSFILGSSSMKVTTVRVKLDRNKQIDILTVGRCHGSSSSEMIVGLWLGVVEVGVGV